MGVPVPAAPDRLSALDAAFLDLETDRAPLHVGWTMRLAGDPPSLAALRRHIDGRLAALPRFRRRIVEPALSLGDPPRAADPPTPRDPAVPRTGNSAGTPGDKGGQGGHAAT